MSTQRNGGEEHPGIPQSEMSGSSRDVVQARNVSGGIHFHTGDSPGGDTTAHPVPRQLPADVHGFVNRRDQLAQLEAFLIGEGSDRLVVSVCVIAGTAGAGKTSLALRWAHQIKDRFPDGQLYINLRGYDPGEPVGAQEALHRFLTALGTQASSVPHDLDSAAALYRSVLADRRVLILLDNAAAVSQVRPLLPGGEGSLVIVTSRNRLSELAVRDGAQRLTLGTLPEDEAVALLRAVTSNYRREDDSGKLAELARLCARLPLALRIAAERAASNPYLRLDDLIAQLRDESALWDALSTGSGQESEAVRTVFAWSYRALPPSAARLFRLLGLHPGPEFGLGAASALVGQAPNTTRQLLDHLVEAHLLEQTGPDRYEFHDLLRAFATERAREEESGTERESALRRVLEWYLHTADAVQSRLAPAEDHLPLGPPPEGVLPQTFASYDAAVDWAEREHTNLQHAVHAAGEHDRLAWQLVAVWWNAQPPSASVADWEAASHIGLEAAERLGDRAAEGLLLTDLGMAHTAVNRLADSRRCHERALRIWRELGDRNGEAHSLNVLAITCLRARRLTDAARHFEGALAAFRELGAEHWQATVQSNLATAHYGAGRLNQAESAAEEALAAHRALANRRGEGDILRLLSDLRREQGRTEDAVRTAEEAVAIALDLRAQRFEGYWILTLGDAQQAAGRYGDALTSYQRSAVLHRRLGNRSREAMAWHGAGETYRKLDRPAEAAHFHRLAAGAHHELGDAWNEALARDGLAECLVLTEDDGTEAARAEWAEAVRLLTDFDDPRALATRQRVEERLESRS